MRPLPLPCAALAAATAAARGTGGQACEQPQRRVVSFAADGWGGAVSSVRARKAD